MYKCRTLNEVNRWEAQKFGILQYLDAERCGYENKHGCTSVTEKNDVDGMGSQWAVAIELALPVLINGFDEYPDVGPFQVRNRSNHDWELGPIRDKDVKDKPDATFIFTTGELPGYRLYGSILCWTVQNHPEWRKNYGKDKNGKPREYAWFIPKNAVDTDWMALWHMGQQWLKDGFQKKHGSDRVELVYPSVFGEESPNPLRSLLQR